MKYRLKAKFSEVIYEATSIVNRYIRSSPHHLQDRVTLPVIFLTDSLVFLWSAPYLSRWACWPTRGATTTRKGTSHVEIS
jgi:hypothetical protein